MSTDGDKQIVEATSECSAGLGGCPVCGGNDLERMSPTTSGLANIKDSFVYQEIECENCGAWFEVVYSFLHIQSIRRSA